MTLTPQQRELLAAAGYEAARAYKLGQERIHPAHAVDPDSTSVYGVPFPWSMISEEARERWRGLVEVLEKNWASSWDPEKQVAASAIHALFYVINQG